MPLEIRELIIRTQIVSDESSKKRSRNYGQQEFDAKVIVDQCVEKVLKSLKKKMER